MHHVFGIHCSILFFTVLCTRRARHLKNLRPLHLGDGCRSIVFRPSCGGCGCALDWAASLLVLLRADFRYPFALLDSSQQPRGFDSVQCTVGILFSWTCHASSRCIPKSLSGSFEARYSSGYELGYLVVRIADWITYRWCFGEESWEGSKATTIGFFGSATLGGNMFAYWSCIHCGAVCYDISTKESWFLHMIAMFNFCASPNHTCHLNYLPEI